jgi:hypothetical protein
MALVNQAKQARKTQGPNGPVLTFAASVLAIAGTMLPRDFALAAVSTFFFGIAAVVALGAWTVKQKHTQGGLNYWDVAGALMLFGICAAAFLDSDQIIRFIESRRVAG